MKCIEMTAITNAIRLARERCEAEGVQDLRIFEHTALCNIMLSLDRVNSTPEEEWPELNMKFQTARWHTS
jgi:hypothetical protein